MIQDVLGTDNGVERRYPPTIKKGFRITMARLDESTSDDSPAQVKVLRKKMSMKMNKQLLLANNPPKKKSKTSELLKAVDYEDNDNDTDADEAEGSNEGVEAEDFEDSLSLNPQNLI
ncbi:hypothetical protein QE152_g26662 [Popillia japonica]|uniref:Uncharacterized protein n=1 Tax=Popillia japonica TaxID=7064 RepID=A0AAW1JW48_POPJA